MRSIPEFGVEIIGGRPGSGKSFLAVHRLLEVVRIAKRPVYTNLPLRWPVMRKWLRGRGGAKLAGLVRPLTKEGFFRFLRRAAVKHAEQEKERLAARAESRPWSREAWHARFCAEHGPDVTEGDGLNWIPESAMVIIDEAHQWLSATVALRNQEDPAVLSYMSLVRHHLHLVWLITQGLKQVSVNCRRPELCRAYWDVVNLREERICWGLRFKHLGVSGLSYARLDPAREEGVDQTDDGAGAVLERFIIFPWLPWHRWKFRLYESFTHAGGMRALRRALAAQRLAAGLTEAGVDESAKGDKVDKKRRGSPVLRWAGRCVWFSACSALAFGIAWSRAPRRVEEAGGGEAAAGVDGAETRPSLGELQSVSSKAAYVAGVRYGVGGKIGPYEVAGIAREAKSVVLVRDGGVWVWAVGEAEPVLVGTADSIVAAWRAREVAAGRAWGGGLESGVESDGGEVEPSSSDVGPGGDAGAGAGLDAGG